MGKLYGDALPKIFQVNWFRRDANGGFLWPGFGENSRVLAWIVERLADKSEAVESPVGLIPAPGALNLDGLDVPAADMAELFDINKDSWLAECDLTQEYFDMFGDHLPAEMTAELEGLRSRLSH
jgi:phosphoenolpyruvate carboxykinase (GTP)